MPPRGWPARARERQCRKCGADLWKQYSTSQGKRQKQYWRCAPCTHANAKRWNAKQAVNKVKRLYFSAKARAKEQHIPFTIVQADVLAAWPADGLCPALGLRLQHGVKKMQDASPTLDRLNGEWGYVPGNIAVLSSAANRAKGKLTADELGRIAAWMRSRGLS